MARLSRAAFGAGGVKPISIGVNTAVPAGFFPPGTGLKKSTNNCGVIGLEESPG